MTDIIKDIKSKNWGNSLTRTGFLQSKAIASKAIMLPVVLTKDVVAIMKSYLWVNDFVTYNIDSINSFSLLFKKAFKAEPHWSLLIIKKLDALTKEKDSFIKESKLKTSSLAQAKQLFKVYVDLLCRIMKYYVIAVPLTDFCERELVEINYEYSKFAVGYKKLDIDLYQESLKQIVKDRYKTEMMKKHLEDFAWIKTAYNIIDAYSEKDLEEALKNIPSESFRKNLPKNYPSVLLGLQSGIYLRNRMKELCQQIWFACEPIIGYLANFLSLSREEFLTLTPDEVIKSINAGKCLIFKNEIKERQKGFAVGFINKEFILFSGDGVKKLVNFFNEDVVKNLSDFKGNIACKGTARGIVKIVRTKNEFSKFNDGEILVTSMTTPDFILLMKKASGIITDEGGLSSHAAIVSRELGVPCIIGTKIATKVLRDGDLVEVDADKGIVRILKRK